MRMLVVIANYGRKNQRYLERVLSEYRSMVFETSLVVLSDCPKDLGADVEVIVGMPTKDPWSLPFGYKEIFVRRADKYDLFIYSEDDTLITERNIRSFLDVTNILPDDKIAGFLRYEIAPDGTKYYSTVHGHYHWDPKSVLKIDGYIFAHYTNEHSACFILTRTQLQRAIDSGGFLLPPRKGRYDMLVTAATEPYTQCGMAKLVCISHLDDFCLRHLPDVYLGRIGLEAEWADREIEKLRTLAETSTNCGPLFDTSTLFEDPRWDKKYYESCRKDILSFVADRAKRVLSVGCGCGSTEAELVKQGKEVVGIPLDCVIAVSAAARGIRTLVPNFKVAWRELRGAQFDYILFQDVLQYLPDPIETLKRFRELLGDKGAMVISVPNFDHPSVLRQMGGVMLGEPSGNDEEAFKRYRLHLTTHRMLSSWLSGCGLMATEVVADVEPRYSMVNRLSMGLLRNRLSRNIVVRAETVAT